MEYGPQGLQTIDKRIKVQTVDKSKFNLQGNKYNILMYDNVENKRVKDSPSSSADRNMDDLKMFRLNTVFLVGLADIHPIKTSFPLDALVGF